MKKIRRALALTISFAMIFTMSSASVFAEGGGLLSVFGTNEKPTIDLLVLGDSTSTGYQLSDFSSYDCSFNVRNNELGSDESDEHAWTVKKARDSFSGRISEESYPWKMKQYIEEKYDWEVECNLSSLCLSGMRTDELRALLDNNYYEKIKAFEKDNIAAGGKTGFLTDHMDLQFKPALSHGGAKLDDGTPVTEINTMQAYTKQEIEKAEVIVMDCCMNNFGTYLAERLSGLVPGLGYDYAEKYGNQTIEDIDDIPIEVRNIISKIRAKMKEEGLLDDQTAFIADTMLFCYADAMTNFTYDMAKIRQLNPDAQIIVVGLYSSFDGINIVVDGHKINLGTISKFAFGLFNNYLRTFDPNRPEYYYADLSGGVDTFMGEMMTGDPSEYVKNEYRRGLVKLVVDMNGGSPDIPDITEAIYDIITNNSEYKDKVDGLLAEAAKHTDVDVMQVMNDINDPEFMEKMIEDIYAFLSGSPPEGGFSETTWVILMLAETTIMDNGIGTHPNEQGCLQIYNAVQKAYDSYNPRYEALKNITKEILSLPAMIRNAKTPADYANIRCKIAKIRMEILEYIRTGKCLVRAKLLNALLDLYESRVPVVQTGSGGPSGSINPSTPAVPGTPVTQPDTGTTDPQDPPADNPQAGNPSGGDQPSQGDTTEKPKPAAPAEIVSGAVPALRSVKAKAAKKGFTVKWKKLKKKQKKAVSAIEVQYSASPSFGSGTVTRRVSSGKASLKVKGLAKGSVYYVRVRTRGAGKYVSGWSGVKRVKVK